MKNKQIKNLKITTFDFCVVLMFLYSLSFVGYGLYVSSQTGFLNIFPFMKSTIYIDEKGEKLYGSQTINGAQYYFDDKTGNMITGFYKEKYYDESGKMVTGIQEINHKTYYFDTDGTLIKDSFVGYELDGKPYYSYFDDKGIMLKGHQEVQGKSMDFGSDGNLIVNYTPLETQVNQIIQKYSGEIGLYFKDLRSNHSFSINDVNMYPCCMIKVPALIKVFEQIDAGQLSYEENADLIETMITISSNTSYNTLMNKIGNNNGVNGVYMVNDLCNRYGLTSTSLHHGLAPGDGFFSDGGANTTRPSDIGILFEKLYRHEAGSSQSCDKMIEILKRCADTLEIQAGLPENTEYAHKTGNAFEYYHDGGIVYLDNFDYILVIFSNGVTNYGQMMQEISSCVYQYQAGYEPSSI